MREIYLMPFMIAQKFAGPWGIMTAYNKVNGLHVCENPDILQGVLRKEWGFDGAVCVPHLRFAFPKLILGDERLVWNIQRLNVS